MESSPTRAPISTGSHRRRSSGRATRPRPPPDDPRGGAHPERTRGEPVTSRLATYDWEHEQWTVPINVTVSQLLKLSPLPIQLSLGGRYCAERPQGGPDWGIR